MNTPCLFSLIGFLYMETPPAILLLAPFALIYYLVALRWADKGDIYGFARAARVYFLVYVLIPAVLGWYYLGLKWAALLGPKGTSRMTAISPGW